MANINPRYCYVCFEEKGVTSPFCLNGHGVCPECRQHGGTLLNVCPACRAPPRRCIFCPTNGSMAICANGHPVCAHCAKRVAHRAIATCPSCNGPFSNSMQLVVDLNAPRDGLRLMADTLGRMSIGSLTRRINQWPTPRSHGPVIRHVRQLGRMHAAGPRLTIEQAINLMIGYINQPQLQGSRTLYEAYAVLLFKLNKKINDEIHASLG